MNNKQKTRTIIYSFISILIIGVLIAFFGGQKTSFPECSGGIQVLSINDAQITYSDDGKSLDKIIINGIANNQGECLSLKIDKNELNSELSGVTATKDLYLSIEAKNQRASIPFTKNSDSVYNKVSYQKIGLFNLCNVDSCANKGISNTLFTVRTPDVFNCYCYSLNPIPYAYDTIRGNAMNIKTDLTISMTGFEEKTITYPDTKSVSLGKANVKISSLVLSNQVPLIPDYSIVWKDNELLLLDKSVRDNYDFDLSNLKKAQVFYPYQFSRTNQLVSEFNTKLDTKYFVSKTFYDASKVVDKIVFENSENMIMYYHRPLLNPQFVITADAVSVGIVRIVSKPSIVCDDKVNSITSVAGSFEFVVKNSGSYSTGFNLKYECPDSMSINAPSTTNLISAGSSEVIKATIGSSKAIDNSCKIIVSDPNRPENSAFCSQSLKSVDAQCLEDEKRCSSTGKNVLKCDNGVFKVVENCAGLCYYQNNVPVCVNVPKKEVCDNKIDDDNDGLIDEDDTEDCKKKSCAWYDVPCQLNQWLAPLKMIMLIVLPLVSLIIVFGMGQDKFKLDKTKSLLLGLVVAGGVLGLVYFYFWAGLVLGLLLLILKILL